MKVEFSHNYTDGYFATREMPMPPRVGEAVRLRDSESEEHGGVVIAVDYGDEVTKEGEKWVATGAICAVVTIDRNR